MKKHLKEEITKIKNMMGLNENISSDVVDNWEATDEVYVKVIGSFSKPQSMESKDYYGYVLKSIIDENNVIDAADVQDVQEYFREPSDNDIYRSWNHGGQSMDDVRDLKGMSYKPY